MGTLQWAERLRWQHYFFWEEKRDPEKYKEKEEFVKHPWFKPTKKDAPKGNAALELFIEKCSRDFIDPAKRKKIRDNLTVGQRTALGELRAFPLTHGVACRYADKSGATVITDLDKDCELIMNTLNDNDYYDILPNDPTPDIIPVVQQWANNWDDEDTITDEIISYVTEVEDTHPGACKPLVKTHKPEPYPIRLLLSGCGTPTAHLAKFAQIGLSHLTPSLPYQVMDSKEFLARILDINQSICPLPAEATMVTCDVIGLYPNVNNDMGIPAVRKKLEEQQSPLGFPPESIVEALTISLNNNATRYMNPNGDTTYARPNRGTAMGPSHACDYVDIFMDQLDDQLVNTCPFPLLSSLGPDIDHKLDWSRFRDDGFIVLTDKNQLPQLKIHLQNLHPPSIRWTTDEGSELAYLDIKLILKDGYIQTDVYSKNCHSYLPPTSCHPPSVFKGIAKGIGHRLRMICSTDELLAPRIDEYAKYLAISGWEYDKAKKDLTQASSLDREHILRRPRRKKDKKKVAWVTKYDPRIPSKASIIRENLHILYTTEENKEVFPPDSIIASNRRQKNLGEIYKPTVPRQYVEHGPRYKPGFYTCNRCDTCAHSATTTTVQSPWDGRKWKIRDNINCRSTNVIYLLRCKIHKDAVYIGSTNNPRQRWAGHKSDCLKKQVRKCTMSRHTTVVPHPDDREFNYLEFIPIEHVPDKNNLLSRESWWQCNFGSIFKGLNLRKDFCSMNKFKNRIQFVRN